MEHASKPQDPVDVELHNGSNGNGHEKSDQGLLLPQPPAQILQSPMAMVALRRCWR